jgi:hypothetical protein
MSAIIKACKSRAKQLRQNQLHENSSADALQAGSNEAQ